MKILEKNNIITNRVRIAYCYFDKPTKIEGTSDENLRYQTTLIIPKEDKQLIGAIEKILENIVESEKNGLFKGTGEIKSPLRDGDEKAGNEAFKNCYFLNAKSKSPIKLFNTYREEIKAEEVFAGCYVVAHISFFPYKQINKGIGVGITSLVKIANGERLGGTYDPAKAYDGIDFEEEEEDIQF
jgi:hypothetical protein